MTLLILFLAIVYKVKFNDILKGFMDGIKRALPLGLITILIYSCLVIVTYHPFQLVIYKALLSGIDKFNVFGALLSSLTALLAGIFNVDPSYAFQSVLLYLTSVVTDSASYSTIGVIFQGYASPSEIISISSSGDTAELQFTYPNVSFSMKVTGPSTNPFGSSSSGIMS